VEDTVEDGLRNGAIVDEELDAGCGVEYEVGLYAKLDDSDEDDRVGEGELKSVPATPCS
jgi:hypothetical protein